MSSSQVLVPKRADLEALRRRNRMMAHFFALYSWKHGADCLVLTEKCLQKMLGLIILQSARIERLCEDIKPWFPHCHVVYKKAGRVSLHSVYISRFSINGLMPNGDMSEEDCVVQMCSNGRRTMVFAPATGMLSDRGMIEIMASMASGLSTMNELS